MKSEGLVAFFDVLGYQNIIDNNSIDEVSIIIRNVLQKMQDFAKEGFQKTFENLIAAQETVDDIIERVQFRLISDSILLALPFNEIGSSSDEGEAAKEKYYYCMLFFHYIYLILNRTFKEGLPLRGAVDYGKFFLEDNCFAGKPIIDCYRIGDSLEFSGCVVTPNCREILQDICNKSNCELDTIDSFGEDYLCPVKNGFEKYLLVLWSVDIANEVGNDLRQVVFEAFKAHNKDIGVGVERKITNTEFTLRFLEQKEKENKRKKNGNQETKL